MSKFVDVQPYHWFYDSIEETTDLNLKDGAKFLSGIPYNIFEDGKQAVDYAYSEKTAHSQKTVNFVINQTDDNPLVAFVDGLSVSIDDVTPDTVKGVTTIKYRRMIPANAQVRLVYGGEPLYYVKVLGTYTSLRNTPDNSTYVRLIYRGEQYEFISFDGAWFKVKDGTYTRYIYSDDAVCKIPSPVGVVDGSYISLPNAPLGITGDFQYVYDPFYQRLWERITCNGVELKRVANSSLIKEDNEYCIENGKLYVHYDMNNSIVVGNVLTRYNGVTKYKYIKLQPYSANIIYNNRFFPQGEMLRVEFMSLLNRLRMHFYLKYTDIEAPRETKTTSRFTDVQAELDKPGNPPWWWADLRDLEELRNSDGTYTFDGYDQAAFGVYRTISRAECMVFINRFRKVMIEAFK